jgi:hypothetical protein
MASGAMDTGNELARLERWSDRGSRSSVTCLPAVGQFEISEFFGGMDADRISHVWTPGPLRA